MLNATRLRVFGEVVAHGSFSAAADALSYSQSAVSQAIATLEGEVGVALIERHRSGVRPTVAGAALAGHANGILARMETAEAEIAAIVAGRGGRLRTASFPTAGATLMPQAIASFRAAHPGVEVTLAEGEPEEIAPRLREGEFDLVLLFEFEGVGDRLGSGMKRFELLDDPLQLALPRDHPLAGRKRLEPGGPERGVLGADLERQPLRPARGALLSRRRLRAPRLLRERRLPDGPGPGRRRRRGRADPRAGALDRASRHRRAGAAPAEPGAQGVRRDAARGGRSRRRWRRCSTCCATLPGASTRCGRARRPGAGSVTKRKPPPRRGGGGSVRLVVVESAGPGGGGPTSCR